MRLRSFLVAWRITAGRNVVCFRFWRKACLQLLHFITTSTFHALPPMSVLHCCVRSNSKRSRKYFPDILLPSDIISINKYYRHLCLCATNKQFVLIQGQSSKIWDFIIFSNLPESKTSQLSTVHVYEQNLFLFCICVSLILSCKYWFIPVTDPNSDKSKIPKMVGFLLFSEAKNDLLTSNLPILEWYCVGHPGIQNSGL